MSQIPKIFDREKVKNKLLPRSGQSMDFITSLVVTDLADRLKNISRAFPKALLLAPSPKPIPDTFASVSGQIKLQKISTLLAGKNQTTCNPENLHLPHTDYDLIISLFDIGFTNNVPGFLNQIFGHLGKDGLFISAFIGGTSFNELRSAWLMADDTHMGGALTRVAPFIDIKDAGSLLQRTGFALPVTDKETLCLRYETPLHLMREIKLFGGSNPLVSAALKPVTRSHLNTAIDAYAQIATDTDGRIRSTLEIIWMSGWKPDASQQKPLKPGSAQISLTKVLGTGKK